MRMTFFLFFSFRFLPRTVFLGLVKVFKLLAFLGRILICAVVSGSLHSFLDTFLHSSFPFPSLPRPPFLLYYIPCSRVYEPGTGSSSEGEREGRGFLFSFSFFTGLLFSCRHCRVWVWGYLIAWGIEYQHARMREREWDWNPLLWRDLDGPSGSSANRYKK